jgi:D-alanyl-D-alanine carboxypeptidase/D-alanyl-D-alanine-endopeptidase (penicillin-binding protein 4)
MKPEFNRRVFLAGLLAGTAVPAVAGAPLQSLRPRLRGDAGPDFQTSRAEALVEAAGLGGKVTFAVADAKTGELLEVRKPLMRMPPASVTKALTAVYALDALGEDHVFKTEIIATGPVSNGRVDGDLILVGSGDPTLDTDRLGAMAAALKDSGIREITGKLRSYAAALPEVPWIDPDQPDHVGYNPAIGGLNLNYNRVHFEWKRQSGGYQVTMEARARKFRPEVRVARMSIEDRRSPIYTYRNVSGVDSWTVAKGALGREGARWLPVRHPGDYAADVFQTLARSYGIVLKRGGPLAERPEGTVVASSESPSLPVILKAMLKYSTNLTAEATGLSASVARGGSIADLAGSAAKMNGWLNDTLGCRSAGFVDHSGLGYGSRVTAVDMVKALASANKAGQLKPLLKDFALGEVDPEAKKAVVKAKTGTLNFVSALGGYVTAANGRELVFAIFTADTERRDAIKPDERERPRGTRAWAGRSRRMQKKLIERWALEYGVVS